MSIGIKSIKKCKFMYQGVEQIIFVRADTEKQAIEWVNRLFKVNDVDIIKE